MRGLALLFVGVVSFQSQSKAQDQSFVSRCVSSQILSQRLVCQVRDGAGVIKSTFVLRQGTDITLYENEWMPVTADVDHVQHPQPRETDVGYVDDSVRFVAHHQSLFSQKPETIVMTLFCGRSDLAIVGVTAGPDIPENQLAYCGIR